MANPATGGFSGHDGTVKIAAGDSTPTSELIEVKKWTFEPKSANPAVCTNQTDGFKSRVHGVRDGTGTIDVIAPEATIPPFVDGDHVTLDLIDGHGAHFIIPAIIESMPYQCDIDGGEFVGYAYNFAITGAWYMYHGTSGSSGN